MGHDEPISPEEAADLAITAEVFTDPLPLTIHIDLAGAWLILSTLQMSVRHPELSDSMRKRIEHLARHFQDEIAARHPGAGDVLEKGWNAANDRPARPRNRD